jgi:hypothetical protein
MHGGGVAVIAPAGELPIQQVAARDVPIGTPYLIVPAAEVPPRDQRANWSPSFAVPHGHGLGHATWTLAEQHLAAVRGAGGA